VKDLRKVSENECKDVDESCYKQPTGYECCAIATGFGCAIIIVCILLLIGLRALSGLVQLAN